MPPPEAWPVLVGVPEPRATVADYFDAFVWLPALPDAVRLSAADFLESLEAAVPRAPASRIEGKPLKLK